MEANGLGPFAHAMLPRYVFLGTVSVSVSVNLLTELALRDRRLLAPQILLVSIAILFWALAGYLWMRLTANLEETLGIADQRKTERLLETAKAGVAPPDSYELKQILRGVLNEPDIDQPRKSKLESGLTLAKVFTFLGLYLLILVAALMIFFSPAAH